MKRKQKTYTTIEAAVELDVDISRVLVLCREKRLGYSEPRHGRNYVITQNELDTYRAIGPLPPGRKRIKPRPAPRLARIDENGNHDYL